MSDVMIPETIRAIVLDRFGPPEALSVGEVPLRAAGPEDVVIRTECAGLIYGDTEVRKGTYYVRPELPWVPGREVAGVIEWAGAGVRRFKRGDRVAALLPAGGACSEYVVAAAERPLVLDGPPSGPMAEIIALPDRVRFDEALVYLVNFRFAHLIFHGWARAEQGVRILVHGASGGMGSMMLQLGRSQGCEVFALCRSAEEAAFCQKAGADHTIDTTGQDYVEEVLKLTGGAGVNFVFNGVGGETINRDPLCTAPFGEILLYGYVAGKAAFDPFGFDRSIAFKTFCADNFFPNGQFARATEAMLAWFREGQLLTPARSFAFAEVAEAHRLLESGGAIGKLVLRP